MKIIKIYLCLLLFFTSSAAYSNETTIFGEGKIGDIYIGMSLNQLLEKYSDNIQEKIVIREGDEEKIYLFTFKSGAIASLDIVGWEIVRATLEDKRFKTKKNIGVGSSFTNVLEAYPDAKFSCDLTEGGYIVLMVDSISATFGFNTDYDFLLLEKIQNDIPRVVEYLGKAKVEYIVIYDK